MFVRDLRSTTAGDESVLGTGFSPTVAAEAHTASAYPRYHERLASAANSLIECLHKLDLTASLEICDERAVGETTTRVTD